MAEKKKNTAKTSESEKTTDAVEFGIAKVEVSEVEADETKEVESVEEEVLDEEVISPIETIEPVKTLSTYLSAKVKDTKKIGIFLHDSPDPDAMASGLALAAIAEKYGIESNIYYGGEITYTKNKAMIQILGINMVKIEDLKEDKEILASHREFLEGAIIAVVDTCSWRTGNCRGPGVIFGRDEDQSIVPNIVIDHHGQSPVGNDLIINKQFGSCSTIMVNLLKEEEIVPDKVLATALYYGLMSDTDDMNRVEIVKEQDEKSQDYLKSLIDFQYYLRIVNCKKPKITMRLEGLAKNVYLRESGNCTVSGIGFIKPGHAGAVSEIADNILSTYQEVENVVVIAVTDEGIGKEKRIRASLRNSGDILDSDDFMKKVFGKKFAGGRKGAAAANKPMDDVMSDIIDMAMRSDSPESELTKIFSQIFNTYAEKIINEIQVST